MHVIKIRLGGHGAAAITLWWFEEGSNSGIHFDQAGVTFQVLYPPAFKDFYMVLQGLPTEVKERFLGRAILIMANHPLVSCDKLF